MYVSIFSKRDLTGNVNGKTIFGLFVYFWAYWWKNFFGYYKHSLINQAEVDKNINHKQSQNSHEHVKTITFWVHEYVIYELLSHSLKLKEFSYMVCKYKLTYISYEFEVPNSYNIENMVLYLQKYFILCSWIWCSSCWCIIAFAMVSHALLCNCNTRNDRQLLMVLSVLQNKWLATNGSKRTTNWASNIDILQYNLVLPVFFVGRKVAFQQLGSI